MMVRMVPRTLFLFFEITSSFSLTFLFLHKYSDWKNQNPVAIGSVAVSWYFSLLSVFLLPLDVATTVFRQCNDNSTISNHTSSQNECKEPLNYVPEELLPQIWRLVYWFSQFLTWIWLPLMQSYSRAGDFTFWEKLKTAIKDNLLYYSSYLCICIICLMYIIFYTDIPLDGAKLRAVASSASNTWGLFLLIILLGYALVDVPRELWLASEPQLCLRKAYFEISKLSADFHDAEMDLKSIVQKIHAAESRLDEENPLSEYMTIITDIIPPSFRNSRNFDQQSRTNSVIPSKDILVLYHKQLKSAIHTFNRTRIQKKRMFNKVYYLQKLISNQKNQYDDYGDVSSNTTVSKWHRIVKVYCLDYFWRAVSWPILLKVFCGIAFLMSAAVVWSEATFFNESPVLSVLALLVNSAKQRSSYITIEVICAITIAYLSYCAYSTIFKIRIFNYYYFVPDHQTDENSLIFSGMMMSRLTPPLCLNFLGLIHMDSHIIKTRILETRYTQVMGHMDVISIISNGFNIYFPMVMMLISCCTYFNIGLRLLTVIGFPQYLADNEITEDIVVEGQRLAMAEKDRRKRIPSHKVISEPRSRTKTSQGVGRLRGFNDDLDDGQFRELDIHACSAGSAPRNIFDDV